MNSVEEKIDLICKISDYLAEKERRHKKYLGLSSTYQLQKLIGNCRDFDECIFSIKNNKLIFSSWLEDNHNGDSYAHEKQEMEITDEMCDVILKDLNNQYEKHEVSRIEKLEEEKRQEYIRSQIVSAKTRFGL